MSTQPTADPFIAARRADLGVEPICAVRKQPWNQKTFVGWALNACLKIGQYFCGDAVRSAYHFGISPAPYPWIVGHNRVPPSAWYPSTVCQVGEQPRYPTVDPVAVAAGSEGAAANQTEMSERRSVSVRAWEGRRPRRLPAALLASDPALTLAYATGATAIPSIAVAAGAAFLSLAQRRLSTRVRSIRRKATSVAGEIRYRDGSREPIDARSLIAAPEAGLRLLWPAVALLALGVVLSRWL